MGKQKDNRAKIQILQQVYVLLELLDRAEEGPPNHTKTGPDRK